VGPCSIHNTEEALNYAKKLKQLQTETKDIFYILMRTYFEKPRTNLGWEGLMMDPDIDDSSNIQKGLKLAREFAIEVNNLEIPIATEFLDFVTPQYLDDLVSWAAIGARTAESQPHRKLASGLSMPVGFKNNTYGDVDVAINAVKKASSPQKFIGIREDSRICKVETKGNPYAHIILRGGNGKPNYNSELVYETLKKLEAQKLSKSIIIDCSHGNSNKNYKLQPVVFNAITDQIIQGNEYIVGIMIESYLDEGNQPIPENPKEIKPKISITDGCISLETTFASVLENYRKLKNFYEDKSQFA
jgi:3-deoxy-7-phosphoheptulonate synthase